MEEGPVRYQAEAGQALITLDRPQARNALSPELIAGLAAALVRAQEDRGVRVVVLTGAGDRAFCAGGDLATLPGDEGFLGSHEGRRAYGQLLLQLWSFPKPTVARVNGHALAGGLGLVLACDFAVAVESAQLGFPEVEVGLFPMMALALAQRHVGRRVALELVLTGKKLSAAEAQRLGLINRAVGPAQLDPEVAAWVKALAGKSQAVLALGKRAYNVAEELALAPALEHLASQLSLNVLMEDAAEGVAAFLQKRPPSWKDR